MVQSTYLGSIDELLSRWFHGQSKRRACLASGRGFSSFSSHQNIYRGKTSCCGRIVWILRPTFCSYALRMYLYALKMESQNQIFCYARCIRQKRVMSLRCPSLRHCARVTQLQPFEEMLQRWRAVGNTVSHLTGPRYKPQTFPIDERVTP